MREQSAIQECETFTPGKIVPARVAGTISPLRPSAKPPFTAQSSLHLSFQRLSSSNRNT